MEPQIYKIAKGWAIFIYVLAIPIIGLFTFLLLMPFIPGFEGKMTWGEYYFFAPLSLAMIGLFVFGIRDAMFGKVIIANDQISIRSTFINRDLPFTEVKGFRADGHYIYIEPKSKPYKRIKISTYIGKQFQLITWLQENFVNLDEANVEEEMGEILSDQDFGADEDSRVSKLKLAKKVASIVNWTGGLSTAWIMFYPNPYEYAVLVSMFLPPLFLMIIIPFKGLIRMHDSNHSAYPSVLPAFMFSCMGLALRTMIDYSIFDYANVWTPFWMIFSLLVAVYAGFMRRFTKMDWKAVATLIAALLFFAGYSYGTVVAANCAFDTSDPEYYRAAVLDKRISSGKTTTYYLTLSPWGPQKEQEDVSVDKETYQLLSTGDSANVYFYKGRVDIPWYFVSE